MDIKEFGKTLIETGDLDPIYVMLNQSALTQRDKERFCLAYWCFYHAGFASLCAGVRDDETFWRYMTSAAANTPLCPATVDGRWPRGTERRHFRAKASINSVAYLQQTYASPAAAIRFITFGEKPGGTIKFMDARARVMTWPAFGPWIGFKVADMLDAVLGYNIDFTGTEPMFFDDPKVGAEIVQQQLIGVYDPAEPPTEPAHNSVVASVVKDLLELYSSLTVASLHRAPKVQEIETVLCKYKGHTRGSYPVGKDTREILHGLLPWAAKSSTAKHLHDVLFRHALSQKGLLDV